MDIDDRRTLFDDWLGRINYLYYADSVDGK
jgi:hypothetical protein